MACFSIPHSHVQRTAPVNNYATKICFGEHEQCFTEYSRIIRRTVLFENVKLKTRLEADIAS